MGLGKSVEVLALLLAHPASAALRDGGVAPPRPAALADSRDDLPCVCEGTPAGWAGCGTSPPFWAAMAASGPWAWRAGTAGAGWQRRAAATQPKASYANGKSAKACSSCWLLAGARP